MFNLLYLIFLLLQKKPIFIVTLQCNNTTNTTHTVHLNDGKNRSKTWIYTQWVKISQKCLVSQCFYVISLVSAGLNKSNICCLVWYYLKTSKKFKGLALKHRLPPLYQNWCFYCIILSLYVPILFSEKIAN